MALLTPETIRESPAPPAGRLPGAARPPRWARVARAGARLRPVLPLPLLAVWVLQVVASLSLRNTAFQDEALYLYAGRDLLRAWLAGTPAGEAYAVYFSGLPYFYPVLAGALDAAGGLELARLLSLGCMLWTAGAVYLLARRLLSEASALPAAALFAVQGPVLFLGRLATYDALSLALLAAGAVLAVGAGRAGRARRALPAAAGVGAVLCLAVAAKYAALLYAPAALAILGWQAWRVRGGRAAVVRGAVAAGAMVAGLAAVVAADPRVLEALRTTTTERIAYGHATALTLAADAAALTGAVVALGAIGLLRLNGRRRLLAVVLLGTAFLAPAYHILKAEPTSLHKHVAFGTLFAAPLAGYALARLGGLGAARPPGRRSLAVLAACLLTFNLGLDQARGLYAGWPESGRLERVLRTLVRPGSDRVLAEEAEVPRYYLQDLLSGRQWSQLSFYQYTDAQGYGLSGVPAYRAALAEGHFDVVVLRYGPSQAVADAIEPGLRDGRAYELVSTLPFETASGRGAYWIWRKAAAPAPQPGHQPGAEPGPPAWAPDVEDAVAPPARSDAEPDASGGRSPSEA